MSEITNPQDAELEEVVLGACLLESKAITLVADILRFMLSCRVCTMPGK